jgi:outer membrane lipoprotein-sorting protein
MGGEAKLAAIKSLKAKLTVTQKTPQGDLPMQMESLIVYPDHLHAEIQAPQGTMTIVVTPDSAFLTSGKDTEPMPAERKAEALEQIKRDPIFIASHWNDPSFVFQANGTEKVGDVEARIVDVNAAGAAIHWYVDPQTGRILRETYKTLSQQGPAQGETQMENWKTVDGITVPMLRRNKQNGQDSSSAEYSAIEFNPSVDPKIFEKPAEKAAPSQ